MWGTHQSPTDESAKKSSPQKSELPTSKLDTNTSLMVDEIHRIISRMTGSQIKLYSSWCSKLLQLYPPKYNHNKFLYGGISEYLFWHLCNMSGNNCHIYGDDHYFDDININGYSYSIKTTKSNTDIIITNYKSTSFTCERVMDTMKNKVLIIVNFCKNKIYFVIIEQYVKSPKDIETYFTCNNSNLSLKKSIFDKIPHDLIIPMSVDMTLPEIKNSSIYEKLALDIIQLQ